MGRAFAWGPPREYIEPLSLLSVCGDARASLDAHAFGVAAETLCISEAVSSCLRKRRSEPSYLHMSPRPFVALGVSLSCMRERLQSSKS